MPDIKRPTGGLTITCPWCGWAGPWNLPDCPECTGPIPANSQTAVTPGYSPPVIVDEVAIQTIEEINRRGET